MCRLDVLYYKVIEILALMVTAIARQRDLTNGKNRRHTPKLILVVDVSALHEQGAVRTWYNNHHTPLPQPKAPTTAAYKSAQQNKEQ